MIIELRASRAATVGDAGPAEVGAFVAVGGGKKRHRVNEGRGSVDGVGGGGARLQVVLQMHEDVMTQLTCLFNELSTKY